MALDVEKGPCVLAADHLVFLGIRQNLQRIQVRDVEGLAGRTLDVRCDAGSFPALARRREVGPAVGGGAAPRSETRSGWPVHEDGPGPWGSGATHSELFDERSTKLAALDRDPSTDVFGRLGEPDGHDAVIGRGLHLVRIHVDG